jgi:hypothetical protein
VNLIGKYWNSFIHLATILCTMFSGFLVAPPSAGAENPWFKFGRFVIAVCIGLWFVPERVWRLHRHMWKWWIVAILFACSSFASVVYYTDLVDRWSVPYWRDQRIVIGQTLTPKARAWVQTSPSATALVLLQAAAGDPTQVYLSEEIETRQRTLTFFFLLTILLLACTVVTVSQAAYCATRQR